MSRQELNGWYEYYQEEPFLADRIELQIATLSAIIGTSKGLKYKAEEYMVTKREQKKSSIDDVKKMLASISKVKKG